MGGAVPAKTVEVDDPSLPPMGARASTRLSAPLQVNSTCADRAAEAMPPGICGAVRRDGRCARFVVDNVISEADAKELRGMMDWLLEEIWGGGFGPPSVIDLHQGSISYKDSFVDLGAFMDFKSMDFEKAQIDAYTRVRTVIRSKISELFGPPPEALLYDMHFFSHINASKTAQTEHDEYWHSHIDTQQYGTFEYTALLYLGSQHDEFEGGTFIFEGEGGASVEPRMGRLVIFTSDSEHPHRVVQVSRGIRTTLTSAFTCSQEKAESIVPWPREGRIGGYHGAGKEGKPEEPTKETVTE